MTILQLMKNNMNNMKNMKITKLFFINFQIWRHIEKKQK